MQLTYLGHSAVRIQSGDHDILIDPFLAASPLAAADLAPSHIVLTHAHGDHYGDTEQIAGRSGATVVSSAEIATYVGARGLKAHGMNIGGGYAFPFGRLTFTPAWHSSSFPDGTYGGMPMGVVLEIEGKHLYHAGDTGLFSDMTVIGRFDLELALIPIGDNYTMGPADAVEAVKLINPKRVVPIHYNTFPVIEQDAEAFARNVEAQTESRCTVLEPGGVLDL